jgi:hypothetical protein
MADLEYRTDEDPISYAFRSSTPNLDFGDFGNYTANIGLQNYANMPKEHVGNQQQNEGADVGAASITFDPGYRFYLAFTAIAVLAMMVALDGTAVSVALPVCTILPFDSGIPPPVNNQLMAIVDYSHGFKWYHNRGLLVWHRLFAQLGRLSDFYWRALQHIWPHARIDILRQ